MKPTLLAYAAAACLATFAAVAADDQPPTLALGEPAPDFKLGGVDGRSYSLKDFEPAKLLVVVFTANHCPTAQYYEPRLKDMVSEYAGRGVAFVAISPNDPESVRLDELGWSDLGDTLEEMRLRAQERQFNFPYLYDGEATVSKKYGPVVTPHVFIFDGARKLRYVGAIDDSERVQHVKERYVRDALDALLAGKEPPVSKTKVVGCSVKWGGKAEGVKAYMAKLAAEPVTTKPADSAFLSALRKNDNGKYRLVTFWATWCAPCVAEFDEFITMNRMYRHRDFELVTVSVNRPDEEKAVLDFLKKKQASMANYVFASAERPGLIDAFNPEWQGGVPYTVLLAPGGKMLYEQTGSIDALALRRKIVAVMNEAKPW